MADEPILIDAPDGSVVEFPAGTSDETITAAMRRAYPPRRPRRGESRSLGREIEGGLAAFNRGIPFSNDISSAAAGALEMVRGGSFREGYDRQRQRTLDAAADFTTRRPNAANFATGMGYAAPLAFTAGASAPQQLAAQAPRIGAQRAAVQQAVRADLAGRAPRGAMLLGNQMTQSGAGGALAGYVYGAGAPEEAGRPWHERLQAGSDLAGPGAAVGLAAPPVLNMARPAWQALASRTPWATQAAESGAGAFGAQVFSGGGRRGPPNASVNTIDRLRNRSMQSVEQLEQRIARERANPQGAVVVDLFDDPGVRTMRAIAQGPGQSGQRAGQVAHARYTEAPDLILNDLNRRLAVAETPEQAMASLNRQYRQASAEYFEPLWGQQLSGRSRAAIAERFQRFRGIPVMDRAARRAEELFRIDVATGRAQGSISDNLPRFMHYMKMGLDEEVFLARMPNSGIGRAELNGYREVRRQFVRTLDSAIPGYGHARSQWGGIVEAQEALEDGASLLTQNHSAIAERMRGMSPFARYHARVGFANEIANRLGLRGSVNGNRNVGEVLGSPEMQRRVAAMFDDPGQAAAFLDTLNQQNMLMRNAGQWGTGSQTYSNAMHGADEALNAMAEMGVRAASGNPGGAARRGAQGLANLATLGAIERRNNQVGADLLRSVSDEREFMDEVLRILREREAQRAGVTRISPAGGAAAAASEQRDRRNRRQ